MRAACTLLLLSIALLLIESRAEAVVQVSNLPESLDVELTSQGTIAHASSFTTGAAATQLQGITVAVFSNSTGTSELRLRADNAGSPGAVIVSLGSQSVSSGGPAQWTFNAGGTPTLSANTTYWVTLGETGSGDLQWDGTSSTAETSPSGWTIGDQMKSSSDGGASWVDVDFGPPNESGRFAVDAVEIVSAPPDLAVADTWFQAIFAVDEATGDRTILSGCADATCSMLVGNGPAFESVYGLALVEGTLLAVDGLGDSVLRVDGAGNRTVVTGCADEPCSSVVGSGISLGEPVDVVAFGPSQLILSDFGNRAVLVVDAAGNRTTLSGCVDVFCSSLAGSGRSLVGPGGLMPENPSEGEVYVVDRPPAFTTGPVAVMKIDLLTGDRTVLSGCIDADCVSIAGTGPNLSRPGAGFVRGDDGSLILADGDLSAVVRIDPITGDRTLVSGPSVGSGPPFSGPPFAGPVWVAAAPDGSLLVTDIGLPGVFRVDPATGDRMVVSSSSAGSGPDFEAPIGLALPEPGALAGLASCIAALALFARRRMRPHLG